MQCIVGFLHRTNFSISSCSLPCNIFTPPKKKQTHTHTHLPEVFILAIILMSWQGFFSLGASCFAVVGKIARMASGYKSIAFDVVYDSQKYFEGWPATSKQKMRWLPLNILRKSAMDLTIAAGFSFTPVKSDVLICYSMMLL